MPQVTPHFQRGANGFLTKCDVALRILVVEDSPTDARVLDHSLRDGLLTPFESDRVESLAEALRLLEQLTPTENQGEEFGRIGLIITDLNLPDSSGIETFQNLHEAASNIPIVILSAIEDVDLAAESVRLGAQDYVVKGNSTPEMLGRIVRFAIERVQRLKAERQRDHATQELHFAEQIQESLYPANGPDLPGFDIAGAAYSADKACGDYFDFFAIPGEQHGLAVGDVCGHGLPAALMMLQVRTCVRLLAKQGFSPAAVLSGVHEAVLYEQEDQRRFTSLFFARLDPATRRLEYASAGHRGYVLKADGSTQVLDSTATVIGLLPEIGTPEVRTLSLRPGDTLFVPTDGFHETCDTSRRMFGEQKMLETVHSSRTAATAEMIENLHAAVREFADGRPQPDDMTAIMVKAE